VSEGTDETQEFQAPQPSLTAPLPVQTSSPRVAPPNLGLLFLAVAAAAFLIGIAVASGMRAPERGAIVAARHVTASGATITFKGGELVIPRDALAAPARITIRRAVLRNRVGVRVPSQSAGVIDSGRLVVYSFSPHDLGFRRPVRIVFRLVGDAKNGTIFASDNNRTNVLGGTVDPDRGTVTLKVRTFRFSIP